ncbi:MAG: FAD binding domain-containing protein [Spirochaetaceae bacterium]
MKIHQYVRPKTLEEAYSLVQEKKGFLIGGGAWSRMNTRSVELAVDLSLLELDYIRVSSDKAEIGAMATARAVETSPDLEKAFGPLLREAVTHIVGVQMRNIVTVGGTVAGKYGFSDLITALLALDAQVELYRGKEIPLNDFMQTSSEKHRLIEKISIKRGEVKGAFTSMRKTHTDFPVLNTAAVWREGGWKVAVGARPGAAQLSEKAAAVLGSEQRPSEETAAQAAKEAAEELSFGSDLRGSSEYRKQISKALVRRTILEASEEASK